ncbi:Pep3/Vps18/deep orange family-domain-containing protein [Chytridium lagenaria]|nr:Pep3/Vps18/deep orange family-domain-containing protein [Chytridium lagenaria]
MSLLEEIENPQERGLARGHDNMNLSDSSVPIFALDRVQFSFPGTLLALEVSNNWLSMALETPTVSKDGSRLQKMLWIDLGQTAQIDEVDFIPRLKQDRIRRIFLDPTAKHLIISTHSGDNYYLFKRWKKPKHLTKFRGVIIESIAWGKPRSPDSTGVLLIGSRQGHVYEAELQPTDDFFKKEEKVFQTAIKIYTLSDVAMPITGIRYENTSEVGNRYMIYMATPERLYTFSGVWSDMSGDSSFFEDVFRGLDQNPNYQEIPGRGQGAGQLQFWSLPTEEMYNSPEKYAWLTGSGIYHSAISVDGRPQTKYSDFNPKMLPYPSTPYDSEGTDDSPISLALSSFHFVLLYKNCIKAVCELNGELVYEETIPLERDEYIMGVTMDPIKGTFWVYTNLVLYELLITEEDRDVWKLYLKNLKFDAALAYVKDVNQRDASKSFEEIALKFIDAGKMDALKTFLLKKLEKTKKQDVTQSVMLCSWLTEIYITELNSILLNKSSSSRDATGRGSEPKEMKAAVADQQTPSEGFHSFLKTYKDRLDSKVIYYLLESHSRIDDLLFFAECVGDYERVITHWITEKRWDKAIEFLSKQNNVELHYKFAGVLFENSPGEAVNLWIKQAGLNSRRLLPALLEAEHAGSTKSLDHAIRYLSFVTKKLNVDDPAVHNYLLSLYVLQARADEEEKLLNFYILRYHIICRFFLSNFWNQQDNVHFDLQYALRLCSRENLTQACITIYSLMGLYEQAVSLALKHKDLELARINADKPRDDDNLRKKLWLLIAQYVIEEKRDIKQAMNYLKHCELLKIEDILPCFPDFVLIDDFKEELCQALEEYNRHIDRLKVEMDEATGSAESIRQDVKELKSRYATISVSEECFICQKPLLTRQFYIFPCQHVFHQNCLMNEVVKNVSSARGKRILDLHDKIQGMPSSEKATLESRQKLLSKTVQDQLKDDLDDLIASDCIFCGDMMIRSISRPMQDDDKFPL